MHEDLDGQTTEYLEWLESIKREENPPVSEIAVTTPKDKLDLWASDMETADSVLSADLVKGREPQMALVGVPMLITRLEFRKGVSRKGRPNYVKDKYENDAYVTVTAFLPPRDALRVDRVNMKREANGISRISGWADLPFDPGSQIVVNDGSTGIYRQCVHYLAESGKIVLPKGPENGGKGESVYDSAPYEWADAHPDDGSVTSNDGFTECAFTVKLAAKNGLRPSDYDTEYNPDGATTFYLA